MKPHHRKMMAPILISAVVVLYYIFFFAILMALLEGFWRYLLGILPIAFALVMAAVCWERIKEIRSGEEDDLGQY